MAATQQTGDFFNQFGGTPHAAAPAAPAAPSPAPTTDPSSAAGGATAAPQITNPSDPAQVRAFFQWRASQPGADPILKTPQGVDYYTTQTLNNGGLTDQNYWTNKSTLAQFGGAVGAGGGTNIGAVGGQGTSPWLQPYGQSFTGPSFDDLQKMPGWQFALQNGVKALDTTAAAKGTVLNGGEKKDVLNYATGLLGQTAQQGWENSLNSYLTNYNVFRNNGTDQFNRFNTVAQSGTNAAGAATA